MTRNEAMLWWKVALHIDEAQLALANVCAIAKQGPVEDPRLVYALQERLREAQAFLLGIFGEKDLLPTVAAPPPRAPAPSMPPQMPMSRQTAPQAPAPQAPVPQAPVTQPTVSAMSPDQLRTSLEQPVASWIPDDPEEAPSETAPAIETPAVEVVESAEASPSSTTANGASSLPHETTEPAAQAAETEA